MCIRGCEPYACACTCNICTSAQLQVCGSARLGSARLACPAMICRLTTLRFFEKSFTRSLAARFATSCNHRGHAVEAGIIRSGGCNHVG